jgi:hypothetical protein
MFATIAATSVAQAEFNVNVNLGVPVPAPPVRVVVSAPPPVLFEEAPQFITPSGLGFYVGVGTPYDIFLISDYYYLYYGNRWHRARHHNGPWVEIPYRQLPPGIRKHRIEQIRSYRDREYRVYLDDRDRYRGRHFRPEHERRQEMKEERRDDRRRDKEELKDERRQDREDRRDEKRDRDHDRHGRD